MGLTGLAGYNRGPIRAAFSLLGLVFGLLLARPLSPLARLLLPVLGLQHPVWQLFVPPAIAFLAVLILFKIVGSILHQKIAVHFNNHKGRTPYLRWERIYTRLGFCVGVPNGVVYFFILMLPVYLAGYFAAEAPGAPPVCACWPRSAPNCMSAAWIASWPPTTPSRRKSTRRPTSLTSCCTIRSWKAAWRIIRRSWPTARPRKCRTCPPTRPCRK